MTTYKQMTYKQLLEILNTLNESQLNEKVVNLYDGAVKYYFYELKQTKVGLVMMFDYTLDNDD